MPKLPINPAEQLDREFAQERASERRLRGKVWNGE